MLPDPAEPSSSSVKPTSKAADGPFHSSWLNSEQTTPPSRLSGADCPFIHYLFFDSNSGDSCWLINIFICVMAKRLPIISFDFSPFLDWPPVGANPPVLALPSYFNIAELFELCRPILICAARTLPEPAKNIFEKIKSQDLTSLPFSSYNHFENDFQSIQ